MENLNILFLESYKALDDVCRKKFSSNDGVTEYLIRMENIPFSVKRVVSDFSETCQSLRHYRAVRNKLTHEPGSLERSVCSAQDVLWLELFRQKIDANRDPLFTAAVLEKEIPRVPSDHTRRRSDASDPRADTKSTDAKKQTRSLRASDIVTIAAAAAVFTASVLINGIPLFLRNKSDKQ